MATAQPRYRPKTPIDEDASYYFGKKPQYDFIPTGCTLLDCVLGGGWPLGRISNVVGDKAVGKTLLGIEACANFHRLWPKGFIWYREAEAAFDVDYAAALGLPKEAVDFGPDGTDTAWETMEDLLEDLEEQLKYVEKLKSFPGGLYIVDSLDAISSRAEQKRKPDEGTFGLEKQKLLGQLFRRYKHRLKKNKIHLMVISQVRDKIGIVFGDKHTRTGGKALDFYASQILWLHHMKTLAKTIGGVKRPTAVKVMAKCKKNKVGQPFRTCEFKIRFGYGVDDLEANVEWLKEVGKLGHIGIKEKGKEGIAAFLEKTESLDDAAYAERAQQIRNEVIKTWMVIEKGFLPRRPKYEGVK
jgi:recombination protein RecA